MLINPIVGIIAPYVCASNHHIDTLYFHNVLSNCMSIKLESVSIYVRNINAIVTAIQILSSRECLMHYLI